MSRAFVNEDAGGRDSPLRRFVLPDRDDPGFDEAAALALLEGAAEGDTESAEVATGYYWGERKLRPYVERALDIRTQLALAPVVARRHLGALRIALRRALQQRERRGLVEAGIVAVGEHESPQ